MKTLVTGATGFVGGHVYDHFNSIDLPRTIDIRDLCAVSKYISTLNIDTVVHLAAQGFVPRSFEIPVETYEINFLGTYNLLQALKENNFKGRFLYIGSGDVYGVVSEEELPVTESHPLKPRNPYSVSKLAAEALCYQWSQMDVFDIVLVRSFNNIGPRQSDAFAISSFAKQICEIKAGIREPKLIVGDVSVTRDFTDVRDAIVAYELLLKKGLNGEVYNVCSGIERQLNAIIDQLSSLAGVNIELVQDSTNLRKSENRRMAGDNKKLIAQTGWNRSITFEKSLNDILNYWDAKV